MVNTRTDAELAAAVQAAVDAMLPQIREQVHEEYRTGALGSNPPPVTIHTWLERFNKQKPHSFEKAVAPVDAENWISHIEKIFDVMDCNDVFKTRLAVYKFEGDALAWWKAYKQAKGGDAWVLTLTWAAFKELFFLQFFPRAEQERLKREYHSIRQRASENSTEYMQRFLRLAGFLGQAAGTAEEQAKNFRWGLHKSILDHVMCIQFTDVAQVADAARNLEILRDRDDYDRSERSDKRHKSGDRYHPYSQQGSHRSHGQSDDRQKNDRQGSDRQGGGGNYRNNNNNNHSRNNNRNSGAGRDQRNRGQQSHRSTNSGSQQSRVPSEGYTHPVCNTCGRRHPGECRRAAGTCFKCGQAGHLQRDCKKNTDYKKNIGASSSGHADEEPTHHAVSFSYSGSAANTSGTNHSTYLNKRLAVKFYLLPFMTRTSYVLLFHDQLLSSEFQDVDNPQELPEYLLNREVEFNIVANILGSCRPITKAPNRMAPIELKELKYQFTGVVGASEKSFEELKQRLVSSPILTLPSGLGGFQIYSDASKNGLSGVLPTITVGMRALNALPFRDVVWSSSLGKVKEAQTRQKSYADRHRRALEFQPGEHVFLKVSPTRGVRRFGIKGKLSPRFIGPFEILDRVGECFLTLVVTSSAISCSQWFHLSLLQRLKSNILFTLSLKPFDQTLRISYTEESLSLIQNRQDRVLRNKMIPFCQNSLEESSRALIHLGDR
ncbi:zinc finger, CCHC-type, retrotransposon gag domain protein [Tanacetum coccineum]